VTWHHKTGDAYKILKTYFLLWSDRADSQTFCALFEVSSINITRDISIEKL